MAKKGFTLVEVTISLALFAVLAYAATTFFVQAISQSNKVAIENEVRETSSLILKDITMEVQNIIKDDVSRGNYCIKTIPSSGTALPYSLYLSDEAGATANCLDYTTRRVVYTVDTAGKVTKQINGGAANQLNSDRAVLLKCPAVGGGCSSVCTVSGLQVSLSGSTPTVSVSVQQKPSITRTEYCARSEASQTIVPRERP